MSPRQPKKPPATSVPREAGKPVVEGVRQALHGPIPEHADPVLVELLEQLRRKLTGLPPNDFVEGVEAGSSLGRQGQPLPVPSNTREIGGQGMYALFQEFMLAWFERQRPETLAALDVVSVFKPEELQALHALARRQVRRMILRQIMRENWIKAGAVATVVGALVQWGAKLWEAVQPWLPALQGLWRLAKAGGAP